ncbi:MAG: hypothetical protein ACW99G_00265, partial [Candidatus Thorarchaeota archaeon]
RDLKRIGKYKINPVARQRLLSKSAAKKKIRPVNVKSLLTGEEVCNELCTCCCDTVPCCDYQYDADPTQGPIIVSSSGPNCCTTGDWDGTYSFSTSSPESCECGSCTRWTWAGTAPGCTLGYAGDTCSLVDTMTDITFTLQCGCDNDEFGHSCCETDDLVPDLCGDGPNAGAGNWCIGITSYGFWTGCDLDCTPGPSFYDPQGCCPGPFPCGATAGEGFPVSEGCLYAGGGCYTTDEIGVTTPGVDPTLDGTLFGTVTVTVYDTAFGGPDFTFDITFGVA